MPSQAVLRKMAKRNKRMLLLAIAGLACVASPVSLSFAQENSSGGGNAAVAETTTETAAPAKPELPPLPDLTFAPDADAAALEKVIETAKKIQPASPDQYKTMQTAIRDASKQLMSQLKNKELPRYQQAEIDSMSASVALMTFFSEESRGKVVEQVKAHLKQRETLGISDVQLAMLAAAHLELQPNKKPAKDIYEMLDEMLAKDKREEMQALRLNLQSSISRLNLLGNKFELDVKSIDKKPVKTEDFAGKFVIVDFFATWCEPCLSEVPRLKKHYEKYREKGLEVVGISLDDDRAVLDKYLLEAKLPWQIIHDNAEDLTQRLQMKFGVAALPTMLLLNKEGTVVSLEARGAELDRLMDMLFEAPTPADPPPKAADDKSSNAKAASVEPADTKEK